MDEEGQDWTCYDQWPGPHTDGQGWDDPNSDPLGDITSQINKWRGQAYPATVNGGVLDISGASFTLQPDGTLINNKPITLTLTPEYLYNSGDDVISGLIRTYGAKASTTWQDPSSGNYIVRLD